MNNGLIVKAGDLLAELDPSDARADEAAASAAFASFKAEALRRRTAFLAAERGLHATPPQIAWPPDHSSLSIVNAKNGY